MEALLTVIVLWLSTNFPLPANVNHPNIKFVSAAEMVAPLNKNQQQIIYTVRFDPGGSLPAWLVNMFVTKGPLQTFQKLKEHVNSPQYRNASVDFIKEQW